jgi:hypothetical protein
VVNDPFTSDTIRGPARRKADSARNASMNSAPTKFSGISAPPAVKDVCCSARTCREPEPYSDSAWRNAT